MNLIGTEIDLLLNEYESRFKAEDISFNTLRAARNSLGKLKKYWGGYTLDFISKEKWQNFQEKYDEKVGGNHFNLTKFFTVFVKYIFNKGLISKKPEIKNMFARRERDARRKKKNWLYTDDEIKRLDKACETDKERLALRLGYTLAFRISDAIQLTWERIILDGKVAYVEFTGRDDKAGTLARCPLPQSLVEMLLRLPKLSKWVFPQERNPEKHLLAQQVPFNAIRDRAGIKKGGFHDLRRYRLSADFKNTNLTSVLVCKTRRISMAVAMENYIRTNDADLELLLKESK